MQPWSDRPPRSAGTVAAAPDRTGPTELAVARATVAAADAARGRIRTTEEGHESCVPASPNCSGSSTPSCWPAWAACPTPTSAAAVSAAGGFGCLGASTMSNEKMVEEMAAVRAATDKPFGVDLLTAMPGGMTEQVKMVIEGGASAFVAGLGVPTEVVDLCHATRCWSS